MMKKRIVFLGLFVTLLIPGVVNAQLRLGNEDIAVDLSGRVQAGYNYRFLFEGDDDHEKNRFFLGQSRIKLEVLFMDELSAELAMDLRGNDGLPEAKDIWLAWEPAEFFNITLGQFKVPVSRQRMLSGAKLNFKKRSNVTDDMLPGRDIGAMVTLAVLDKKYKLMLGAFTGKGDNQEEDDNEGKPLFAARIEAKPFGKVKKGEGDHKHSDFGLLIGVNGSYSQDGDPPPEDALHSVDGTKLLYGGDITIKFKGIFLTAEYLVAHYTPKEGKEFKAGGYMVQASYFLEALGLEPAVRFSNFNPSDLLDNNQETTLDFGLNYYPLESHELKAMLGYSYHFKGDNADEKWKEDEITLTVQMIFK